MSSFEQGSTSARASAGSSTGATGGELRHRRGDPAESSTPSTIPMTDDQSDTILIAIRASFSEPTSSGGTPRGQRVSRQMTVNELKTAVVEGTISVDIGDAKLGDAAEWTGVKFIRGGRVLMENETLGDVVGPAYPPETLYTFIVSYQTPTNSNTATAASAKPTPASTLPPPASSYFPTLAPPLPHTATAPTNIQQEQDVFLHLLDLSHFLLFVARHHLFLFLDLEPLSWSAMTPPPRISQEEAVERMTEVWLSDGIPLNMMWKRERRLLKLDFILNVDVSGCTFGQDGRSRFREERDKNLTLDVVQDALHFALGKRLDTSVGQTVAVEIDGITLDLHIPPLMSLDHTHRVHLCQYLYAIENVRTVNESLEKQYAILNNDHFTSHPYPHNFHTHSPYAHQQHQPFAYTTSTTIPPRPYHSPEDLEREYVLIDERRAPTPPIIPILRGSLMKAVQAAGTLWMLTGRMAWTDYRFIVLASCAAGWWLVDVCSIYNAQAVVLTARARAEGIRRRAEQRARLEADAQAQHQGQGQGAGEGLGGGSGGQADIIGQGDGGMNGERSRGGGHENNASSADATTQPPAEHQTRPTQTPTRTVPTPAPAPAPAHTTTPNPPPAQNITPRAAIGAPPNEPFPQLPLFLQHHPDNPLVHVSLFGLDDESRQLQLATNPTGRPQRVSGTHESRSAWVHRNVVLPVFLWLITLVPMMEYFRERAIRAREKRMREAVQARQAVQQPGGGGDGQTGQGQGQGQGQAQEGDENRNLPPGLNLDARRYYVRTLARGEGIDWEEEMEAQRAMGGGDEGAQGGAGGVGGEGGGLGGLF